MNVGILQDGQWLEFYLWLSNFLKKCSEQKFNGPEYVPYIGQGNVWQGEKLIKWELRSFLLLRSL
jgi:hypothetical protein